MSTTNKILILLLIPTLLLGFTLPLNPTPGWYQQFLPSISNQQISDIFFIDSLTGWAVTQSAPINDSAYILKTTNGGDNWTIKFRSIDDYSRVKFINRDTGFVCGGDLLKSTNAGENWLSINRPNQTNIEDMSALNNDTLWLVDSDGLVGGVFRTTNGGASWTTQYQGNNPGHIYMYNRNIGFISDPGLGALYRTMNSGINWTQVTGTDGFNDMYMVDSLTGWKASGFMRKTTNGGLNWVQQTLPSGGIITGNAVRKISVLNSDTIWGVGGTVQYPNLQNRGMIYRTTNGGVNWLFQIPDTAIHIPSYSYIQFINSRTGWAYSLLSGIHTTDGGDPVWYTGIKQISSEVPKEFKLYQNYPNPFNNSSKFRVQSSKLAYVEVKIFDVTGKLVTLLLNQQLSPGKYEIAFDGKDLPSGVYFYSLIVNGSVIDTKKAILLK